MKNTVRFLLTLILVSALYLSNTFAQYQDYRQLSLPEGTKARLGKGWISGEIAYSPNGMRLAVASSIGIWIYDANTFAEVALLTGHTDRVRSVAFSPDGKTLISAGDDSRILIWDINTGQLLHILEEHTSSVNSVAFSPDGKMFASGGSDWRIRLWDTDTGQLLRTIRMYKDDPLSAWGSASRSVYSVAFSPDGTMLAAGVRNNDIWMWNVNTWQLLFRTGGHSWGVESVAFSSDGITLASGAGDGKVQLWGARTGKHWQTVGDHDGSSNYVTFSPDGKILASAGNDTYIPLWDAVTGEHLYTLTGHTSGVLGVSFSPDGQTLASASWYEIRFWDVNTGQLLHTLEGGTASIDSMALSPDGRTLANGLWGGAIQLSDISTGEHKRTLRWDTRSSYNKVVNSVSFNPDGTLLASGGDADPSVSFDKRSPIYLSNTTTGQHKDIFTGHREVYTVSFSPDGTLLASGGEDARIRLWDVNAGQLTQTINEYKHNPVRSLSFSPDGQTFASASFGQFNGGIYIYHVRTGRRLKNLVYASDLFPYSVAFSPDGSMIAGTVNKDIWFWDPRSGERVQKLIGHTVYTRFVAFSPDGKTLASVGNREIRLWDVDTGNHKDTFWGHTGTVNGVSFSPDGHTLVSGSYDGTVLLWNLTPSALPNTTPSTPATSNATVSISPTPVQSPVIGQQLAFSLAIANGENVAGYQATVHFDTSALHYVESANADYLPAGTFAVPATVKGNTVTLGATSLAGENNGDGTLATITFEVVAVKASTVSLSNVLLTDKTGGSLSPQTEDAEITKPETLSEDVNKDGIVNIVDLTLVASNFGQTGTNAADVNGDGVVNIVDLTLVAAAFGNTAAAPEIWYHHLEVIPTRAEVRQWLNQARQINLTDPTFQRGLLMLERLLTTLTPKETALLPNYPNPFNPETWIPYQLAEPANVTVSIYAADGKLVQTLNLGHRPVGIYQDKSRAAYWDGRNTIGEPVASGVYFYTLTAGEFTATRKMLIRK